MIDNTYRKLKIIVKFNDKQMTALESKTEIPIDHNFTVELESMMIKLSSIIHSAMKTTGMTYQQLSKTLPKENYEYYEKCRCSLQIIVHHGLPLLSVKADNILPHQMQKSFDGMCLTIQQHLDNLIRLNKLTPNAIGTKDLKTFE